MRNPRPAPEKREQRMRAGRAARGPAERSGEEATASPDQLPPHGPRRPRSRLPVRSGRSGHRRTGRSPCQSYDRRITCWSSAVHIM